MDGAVGFYTEASGASAVFQLRRVERGHGGRRHSRIAPRRRRHRERRRLGFEVDDLDAALLQVTHVGDRTNPLWFTPPDEQEPHRRTLTC
jgi:hypothetical protein